MMMMMMKGASLAIAAVAGVATAQYTGGDTSGCGQSHWFPGLTQYRDIDSSGKERSYSIHLPSDYDENVQYPTILGFHGSDSVGFFFEADTRLSLSAYTADKIMVYPTGLGGAWAGANYSESTVEEDLQYVSDILTDVRANFCIDSARIYATGMSIGGGFVNTIACNGDVGKEFAAFAPASGSFYTDNDDHYQDCKPARVPTPILEFHGGADEDVSYTGGVGQGGTNPDIETWLGRWAERNECGEPTREDLFEGDVEHYSWECSGQVGAVQHYKTVKQKHSWAATIPNFSQIAAGDLPTPIDASEIIQDFFKSFTRPEE